MDDSKLSNQLGHAIRFGAVEFAMVGVFGLPILPRLRHIAGVEGRQRDGVASAARTPAQIEHAPHNPARFEPHGVDIMEDRGRTVIIDKGQIHHHVVKV